MNRETLYSLANPSRREWSHPGYDLASYARSRDLLLGLAPGIPDALTGHGMPYSSRLVRTDCSARWARLSSGDRGWVLTTRGSAVGGYSDR